MMKKTLVAVAAMAVTGAFAQSTVSIDGIMDANMQAGKEFGQDVNMIQSNGARTSAFNFRGTEDLGGGLRANFLFQIQPSLIRSGTNTSSVATGVATAPVNPVVGPGLSGPGEVFVGLSGGFGTIRLGTPNTHSLATATTASQGFGTGIGSGYSTLLGTSSGAATRYESAVRYISPTFSGLLVSAYYAPGQNASYGTTTTVTNLRANVTEFGLSYTMGKLTANYALLNTRAATTTITNGIGADSQNTVQTLGVRYDFGVASVGYGRQTVNFSQDQATGAGATLVQAGAGVSTTANTLSVSVPMGMNRIMGLMGNRSRDTNVAAQTSVNGETSTFYGLAFERDLSKRTFVYVRAEGAKMNDLLATGVVVNNAAATVANFDRTRSLLGVGISHSF